MFVERLVLWITWGKVCIREEFWNVYLLMTEFDCPEMTLCGWQDVQIQLLTNWLCTGFCGYDWERHDATFWKCPLHSCKLTVWLISVTVTGVLLSEESCIIDQYDWNRCHAAFWRILWTVSVIDLYDWDRCHAAFWRILWTVSVIDLYDWDRCHAAFWRILWTVSVIDLYDWDRCHAAFWRILWTVSVIDLYDWDRCHAAFWRTLWTVSVIDLYDWDRCHATFWSILWTVSVIDLYDWDRCQAACWSILWTVSVIDLYDWDRCHATFWSILWTVSVIDLYDLDRCQAACWSIPCSYLWLQAGKLCARDLSTHETVQDLPAEQHLAITVQGVQVVCVWISEECWVNQYVNCVIVKQQWPADHIRILIHHAMDYSRWLIAWCDLSDFNRWKQQ